MLIEFAVSNFRSIRDEQRLSMVATSLTEREESNVFDSQAPGVNRLLRSTVIYGANAAGKSNLLRALDVMQDMVLLSANESQVGEQLPAMPFALDEQREQPTTFEVVFVSEGQRYQYGFSFSRERILSEWLIAYPEKRAQLWFQREFQAKTPEYKYRYPNFRGKKKTWEEATRSNSLFLSTAVQLNSEQLIPVFNWFQKTLRVSLSTNGFSPQTSFRLMGKSDGPEKIVRFLRHADMGIDGLELREIPLSAEREELLTSIPESMREKIRIDMQTTVRTRHMALDGKEIWWDLKEESHGTQRFFGYAGPIYDVLENGRVLVVDEINNSLHPLLVRQLIETFHSPASNPKGAQLIFVTHATSILSTDIFRRDQIWFAEKNNTTLATTVYPLTDFKPRAETALAKGYLQGRYGAIPFLSGDGLL